MTTVSATASSAPSAAQKTGFAALGAGDFVRLMTAQMQMQDPFDPVDNKEMLAQMAQFTSLSSTNDMAETLRAIAEKLDAVLIAQQAAASAAPAGPDMQVST